LTALGLSAETIHGSLRFSFSELNTVEEVDYVLEVLPGIVARLRDNAVDTAGIGS
jgi:cysteine desulfurase